MTRRVLSFSSSQACWRAGTEARGSEAVRAIHEFLAFQRSDHRTEGHATH